MVQAAPTRDEITFSFGENWKRYLETVSDERIAATVEDIERWLGREVVEDASVLDAGSGSGIHSLAFLSMNPARLHSFDYDPNSVEATRSVWERAGRPDRWTVEHGSVLDTAYLSSLGSFDIVYSWGVLHHTGAMWEAIGNAARLVKPGGRFLISIYMKGPNYERDLALKRRYNAASRLGKRWMEGRYIARDLLSLIRHGRNPLGWFRTRPRGMSPYHDVVDWLGGLPYEVASEEEVVRFCGEKGLAIERSEPVPEGGCGIYLFTREAGDGGT